MSNARKLQTEIDRVMKKVDEGVELFDEIWEKVYAAEQQNQKEKYEMDLKKEIKKLQRLRDQIKTWIGSSDVKDKDPLVEARKLIESKMEQFKICEKETKTKTYSKEGLAREEKLDPAEVAKLATTTWLGEYIETLQEKVEEEDFEIERLSSGKGRKTNKHQIEELTQHIANHKFHISKLEGIIRLVNNDRLDSETVDAIKEDLDYYLESYADDDYMQAYDEEYIYEPLGLDELDVVNVDRVTNLDTSKKKSGDDAASANSKGSKDKKAAKKSSLSSVIPLTIGRARSGKAEKEKEKKEEEKPTPSKAIRSNSTSSSTGSGTGATAAARTPAATTPSPAHTGGASMAAILKRETEQQQEKERQKQLREQQAKQQAEQLRQQQAQRQQQEAQLRQQEALRQQQEAQQEALKQQQQQQQQEALRQQQAQQEAAAKQQAAQLQAQQQAAAEQKAKTLQNQQQMQSQQGGQTNALDILTSGLGGLGLGTGIDNRASAAPLAGGAPTSTVAAAANNPPDAAAAGSSYLTALNESFGTVPNTADGDRSRQYAPQNPYPTPASYPTAPASVFDNPAVFEKLGTDCLFFIFYYAQGTYQQYLAARELKKQSWRFHKKYMTWFQRHEEPKITTDEYEQGTYVYFDYETGWCTRIKQDFRFDYSFLEDSLQ